MIQVGQVLDKYELLERVGQGGMAIVYRGLDRQLKRTVAIKILHKHLSDYQEARDRFEREAQAVAKLRHENILEIFDYSAKVDSESYIVTEFIDGQTLKQFITERPIQYPEVGAMIMLQVCRALAHAHAGGILHRDIKPENIMIRSDGIVKLMDFGISHMVDLERLTVTGQLLGSPAYMAPEHVEGRPLDFRTDVFAVGIVLYQLCVGKLPFEGKNPHEVLKRIAECRFVDPRQANPRIGNRLGKIILRAMAAAPNDRYAGISQMVMALEGYLEESGLPTDKVAGELGRYFKAPGPYELALKERLIDALIRRGQQLLDDDNQAGSLDVFDRVLTIDPQNAKVLAILDRLNRRARLKNIGIAVAALVAVGGGAFAIHQKTKPPPPEAPSIDQVTASVPAVGPATGHASFEPPLPAEPVELDAGVADVAPVVERPRIDAAPAVVGVPTQLRFFPPKDVEFSVDKGEWSKASETGIATVTLDHEVEIAVRNASGCCLPDTKRVQPGKEAAFNLAFRPGHIKVVCDKPNIEANVTVDGSTSPVKPGMSVTITFEELSTRKPAIVQFLGEGVDPKPRTVEVAAGKDEEVKCAPLP